MTFAKRYTVLSAISEGTEENEEPVEDLLKPGHLSRLEEQLDVEMEALSVGNVVTKLQMLLMSLRTHRDACEPPHLQV